MMGYGGCSCDDRQPFPGMGGFWDTLTTYTEKAAAVAEPVAKVYATVEAVKGQKSGSPVVIQAPTAPVSQGGGSLLDSFGPQNHQLVLYSVLGVGALVLFKMAKS